MDTLLNSITKLIVRQGADTDRKNITLASGELGFTTDTGRLFVGDGYSPGGLLTGNIFQGTFTTDISLLEPAETGDTAFNINTNKYYVLRYPNTGSLSAWIEVGGVYTSGSPYLSVSNSNILTINPLSANIISSDAISYPLIVSNGRITLPPLSTYLPVNSPLTTVGNVISLLELSAYSISNDAIESPIILNNGRLALQPLSGYVTSTSPIIISGGNNIELQPLSSWSISSDGVSSPIIIDNNGRVALAPLSAGYIHDAATSHPIIVDNLGKIGIDSLSSYVVNSQQIEIGQNYINLKPLSAGFIAPDAITHPLIVSNDKLTLSQLSTYFATSSSFSTAGNVLSLNPISAYDISENAILNSLRLTNGKLGVSEISAFGISSDAIEQPLSISPQGRLKINPLSAGSISTDAVSYPIVVGAYGKLTIDSIPHQLLPNYTFSIGEGFDVRTSSVATSSVVPPNTQVNPLTAEHISIEQRIGYGRTAILSAGDPATPYVVYEYSRNIDSVDRISEGVYSFRYPYNEPLVTLIETEVEVTPDDPETENIDESTFTVLSAFTVPVHVIATINEANITTYRDGELLGPIPPERLGQPTTTAFARVTLVDSQSCIVCTYDSTGTPIDKGVNITIYY